MRLAMVVLVSLGMSTTLAAQQEDTVVTHVSSDTVTVQQDSALADSVPITVTRVDTVGWDFTWQVIPGSRIVTDMWRFVITSLLCVGCVPADTVAPPPPVDTTSPPPPPAAGVLAHISVTDVTLAVTGTTLSVDVSFTTEAGLDSLYLAGPWGHQYLVTAPPGNANPLGVLYPPFPPSVVLQYDVSGIAVGQTVTAGLSSRTYKNGVRSGIDSQGNNIGPLRIPWSWSNGTPTPAPPPPPPPPGTGQVMTFDDGTSNVTLGINMAGSTTAYGQLPWRKHSWVPTGGVNGTGAINMHWFTGMGIGFSPVWITVPRAQHFKLRYVVKQTAPMQHAGSAIKLLRMCTSPCIASNRIGTLESKQGQFVFYWDIYETGGATNLGAAVPTDGQWHVYELELDYRTTSPTVTFWLDGIYIHQDTAPRSMAFPAGSSMIMSPFAEMYSCGNTGCQATINTGDYTVDDFTFTALP